MVTLIKKYKFRLLLAIIVAVACYFRFYNLSSVPPSPSLDEVSIGYNAYSILHTGKDEYGYQFPLLLRAYDDWRPALYVYLVIPFIKIFGLNVLEVRLPSALLSIMTVASTYFLVKKMFEKYQQASNVALLTLFLLAISPWHIYISRLGHEVNAGLAFFIFGLTFFFYERIFLSLLFLTLSFISYQSEKVFIPIIGLSLLFLFYKTFLKHKKETILSTIVCVIILIPFVQQTFSPNALIRFQATNAISANKDRFDKSAGLLAKATKEVNLLGKFIYNRRTVTAEIVLENYFSHFNPVWLFTNPSSDRHKVPNIGLLYPWEGILFFIGLFSLFFLKINRKIVALLALWFFASPISSAITTDAPHALRSLTFLPTWQIGSSFGLLYVYTIASKFKMQGIFMVFCGLIVGASMIVLQKQYFEIFPKTQSSSFQYALSKAVPEIIKNQHNYSKIIVSNKDALYQSYMFYLFGSKYNPSKYVQAGGTKSGGFAEFHKIENIELRPIIWEKDKKQKNTLFIGNTNEFGNSVQNPKFLQNLDGKDAIEMVSQ